TISVSHDGTSLIYEGAPGQSDSPSFEIGANEPNSGWVATFGAEELRGAAKVHFDLGLATRTLRFESSEAGVFNATLERDDVAGEQHEHAHGIHLGPGQVAHAGYERFEPGGRLPVIVGARR